MARREQPHCDAPLLPEAPPALPGPLPPEPLGEPLMLPGVLPDVAPPPEALPDVPLVDRLADEPMELVDPVELLAPEELPMPDDMRESAAQPATMAAASPRPSSVERRATFDWMTMRTPGWMGTTARGSALSERGNPRARPQREAA
jgi:hypothetical protein